MSLDIIALALILLEGIQFALNQIAFSPIYISLAILFIGILKFKQKQPKSLRYSAVGCFIIFILSLLLNIEGLLFTILYFLFLILLLYELNQLVKNKRLKRASCIFIACHLILLVFIQFDFLHSFLRWVLVTKVIFTYIIAYYLYKHNTHLENENIDPPKKIKPQSSKVWLFTFIGSLVMLLILEKTLMITLYENQHHYYSWYGEIEDEIILQGFAIDQTKSLRSIDTSTIYPRIWLKEDLFEDNNIQKYDFYITNGKDKLYSKIDQKISNHYYEFQSNNPIGQINSYVTLGFPNYGAMLTDKIIQYKDQLIAEIKFYDTNDKPVLEYTIPLTDREKRAEIYSFKDKDITVKNLQIDGDFMIRVPTIIIDTKVAGDDPDRCFIINTSKELTDICYINNLLDIGFQKITNDTLLYQSQNCHYYLPHGNTYYLHLANRKADGGFEVIQTWELTKE